MNEVPEQTYMNMLNILNKLTSNIVSNPNQDKFRTVRKFNKVLQNKLFIHRDIDRVLTTLGFAFDSDD